MVDEPARTEDELIRAAHEIGINYEQSEDRVLPAPQTLYIRRPTRSACGSAGPRCSCASWSGDGSGTGEGDDVYHLHCRPARAYTGR